jgi:anti-sigma B factor antagonist
MQLEKYMLSDVTVIALDGSLDSGTAPRVQEDLEELVPDDGLVLLDLSKMSYMSSAGLRVLLLVYRQAQRSGAHVALAAVPADVHEVLAATGFLDFFTVADSVEAAVEMRTA